MAATLEAIAKTLGVSQMTVSRVLNNKYQGRVSATTRERVLEVARESGYRPNRAAQALANSGKTRTIALWVRDLSMPYFGRIASYLERTCVADGYELIVRGCGADRSTLAEWPVDGIMAFDSEVDDKLGRVTRGPNDPAFVSADVYVNREYDYVYLDLAPASRDAVLQMAQQGCKRIAHVSTTQKFEGDSRWEGYLNGMKIAGLKPELISVEYGLHSCNVEALRRYFEDFGVPDGFACRNDEFAKAIYFLLRKMGKRIPGDACIVGCDGAPDLAYFEVPISTIDAPIEDLCRTAWQFLKNRVQFPDCSQQVAVLTSPLIVRESSCRNSSAI